MIYAANVSEDELGTYEQNKYDIQQNYSAKRRICRFGDRVC